MFGKIKRTLKAVSGIGAMTSSRYDDIANVFVNVAKQSRIMGDDLNKLGSRGFTERKPTTSAKSLIVTEPYLF